MLILNKNIVKLLVFSLLILVSCQQEIEEQKTNTEVSIAKDSQFSSYLQRVVMVKTAEDDVIDKSSYCTVKFPYTVTVNNEIIAINSADDYAKVVTNINANTNDDDIVKISFPVTMIYYDYEEELIENQQQYNSLLAFWNSLPELLTKINCLKVSYPIVLNVYNSSNQSASSVVISNDEAFYNFINNLTSNKLFAINYPISVKVDDHTESIYNNEQFDDAIEDAIEYCSSNNNNTFDFMGTITSNSWKVSYFYDESDKTSLYKDYQFVFKNDFTVKAVKSSIVLNGTWETKLDNGVREFKIHFDSSTPFHELDEGWKLFEFNNSQIRFRGNTSDGGLKTEYLYLTKI
ncbi:hypothetical protein [Flavobacterium flavipallidum]|uniref:Lipoprotein n=1 Tax=Flavobacterium flavipallidum TaxID=3139140 RepID=A0ABU9HMW7_9FLAO